MRTRMRLALMLCCLMILAPGVAVSDEDECTMTCTPGKFNHQLLECIGGSPQDCEACEVTCPGDGCAPTNPACCGTAGNPPCEPV
jgi:hypothetical protein